METTERIFVAGHRGLVGSAISRCLANLDYKNLITRTRDELDLLDQHAVRTFFAKEHPEFVFLAAARVGGILANNTYPAEFIYQNLALQSNVIHEAWRAGVKRLLFLGSSCIYPRECAQPMREDFLLTGPLEPTNRPYAVAKIAGIEMCWSYNRQYGTRFLAAMPTNSYGLEDNYDLQDSHVLPALIRKMHEAKEAMADSVVIWGTGTPRREFLYADDLAEGLVWLMNLSDNVYGDLCSNTDIPPLVNVGYGEDVSIRELADLVAKIVGFSGQLKFDTSKPDGMRLKLLDVSKIFQLGWRPKINLEEGIRRAYAAYRSSMARVA